MPAPSRVRWCKTLSSESCSTASAGSRRALGLIGLVTVAALLRFSTLGLQSFWYDEALTVRLVGMSLGEMLIRIPLDEANPPGYYLSAWAWAKAFGPWELGLRSLSALAGTATVVVVYAAARELGPPRGALAAGSLVATSPVLVWYSQEARPYAFLCLLSAVSFLFFLRACRKASQRTLAMWALASSAALMTHHFAAFLVAAEAVWLLVTLRQRMRRVMVAVAAVGLVGALGGALALEQRSQGLSDWIAGSSDLSARLAEMPKHLLLGTLQPGWAEWAVAAAVAFVAIALTVTRGEPARRATAPALVVAAVATAVPVALAFAGADVVNSRNGLAAAPVLAVALGVALGVRRPPWVGAGVATGLSLFFAGLVLAGAIDPRLQRNDLRAVAHQLEPSAHARTVLVSPDRDARVIGLYIPGAQPPPRPTGRAAAREIAFVLPRRFARAATLPGDRRGGSGCRQTVRYDAPRSVLLAWRCTEPVVLDRHILARLRIERPIILHQPQAPTPSRSRSLRR